MALYEHIFIARPEISPQRAEELMEEFGGIIKADGGEIGRAEYWGLRDLAYPIRKNQRGHYVLLDITAEHKAVGEMERRMRQHDDILRFLTLKVDEHELHPSVMMRHKERAWEDDMAISNMMGGDESSESEKANKAGEESMSEETPPLETKEEGEDQ